MILFYRAVLDTLGHGVMSLKWVFVDYSLNPYICFVVLYLSNMK